MPSSPTSSGKGGGGAVITRALYGDAGAITIADGGGGNLEWAFDSGTALLDLTDPSLPTVVAAGVYAVSAEAAALTNVPADGWFLATLDLDWSGEGASVAGVGGPANASLEQPVISVALTYYVPAGGQLRFRVNNFDGAPSVDFGLGAAVVQRLS